ncbi:MAG: nucleotidyltransferase domain-containing protein [Spirochaetota bacterium]
MNEIIAEIIQNLKKINIKYLILFGSYATNSYDDESDIDLVVVLDSEEISQSYEQKLEKKMLVRDCIYEQSRKKAIDLIVYTNAEYNIIKKNGASFYHEIKETGKILYEKAS